MQVLGVTVGLPTPVPVLTGAVCASFTSPADDFVDDEIDHQRLLIANRPANLLVRVAGDSMLLARLRESDLALVDRSLTPRNGDVVVVDIDGERSFKGWWRQGPRVILSSANPRFPQVPPRTGRGGRSLGRGLGVDQPEAPHGISRANALSDGNSFYCSCERGFDAGLARVPVIVLSNNDGCAIARIPEAKALGIRKSEPFFGIHDMCRSQGVWVYSSNYALYGDISARMNTVYRGFSPRIEIYSIYQSILDLPIVREADRVTLCRDMREMVWSWTGIPTCVSIGSIKTLAKLANHVAKKVPKLGGLCDLTDPVQYDDWMGRIPPEDMRGVGPANARKLTALGCESVADVRDLDTRAVWKAMTVVGERLV